MFWRGYFQMSIHFTAKCEKNKCSTNQQLNIFKQINRFLLSGVFKFINMMTDLKITCSILKIILSYVICLHRIYLHKIFEKAKLF